ncbi:MAG: Cytosol non-specific dipeptidase [Thermoanaerobaculia bacterium]|nr:Cytosol non-specific dipeptidase [Thermoanaerobaculia bacterium]
MANAVSGLAPQLLWDHFAALAAIPRASRNEEGAAQYVLSVARRLGLPADRDSAGNIVVRKPASPGRESAPVTVLQGHLDMVCEKNASTAHDFAKDPIRLIRDGDWIKADGTTLGADNGIGVAAALAVLEATDLSHPAMECLFTIDEETGLTGAFNLSPTLLSGTRMLNLDTEEEGAIYIGCAGGVDTLLKTSVELETAPGGTSAHRLRISGLRGGHSGVDIHEGRGNALKILARAAALATTHGARFASFSGGSKRNALPREAFAILTLPVGAAPVLSEALRQLEENVRAELGKFDTPVAIALEAAESVPSVMSLADAKRVIAFLQGAPHGVLAWSPDVPNLVQTSTNLAVIATEGSLITLSTSQRSPRASAKREAADSVHAVGELAGFAVEHSDGYPGWAPNPSSPLLAIARRVHEGLFGKDPEVKAIHAGLECGIITEKYPGIDVISFGPTIKNAHSPDETVSIGSVERFWTYLKALLAEN